MTHYKWRGIYLITPDNSDTDDLIKQVNPLLNAGIGCLQYRNKIADTALRYQQAQALQSLCQAAKVPLIINDHLQLAYDIGAAGVHLGEEDGDISAARHYLGPDAIIGVSCYDSISRAQHAVAAGANYVAFGAFFPTISKHTTRRAPLDVLIQSASLPVPRVAIGGIRIDNARPLVAAGADMLAIISGIFAADNPLVALRAYQQCFDIS